MEWSSDVCSSDLLIPFFNDFDIQEGDILVLKEWDKETASYTGRELEREVGYVGKWKIADLTEFWPLEDIEEKGIQVISLK